METNSSSHFLNLFVEHNLPNAKESWGVAGVLWKRGPRLLTDPQCNKDRGTVAI